MSPVLEPPVQYAQTSDGVSIAYTAFGNREGGVPLVCLRPPQLSHMALEFKLPFESRWHEFETLSQERLIVRFDSRGSGLSDRGVTDISLEARCRDIGAVADRLELDRFALQGHLHSGSWAIAYAAANRHRVSHLILTQAYISGSDYWGLAPRASLQPLASIDWMTYTEASMSSAFEWAPGYLPRALAEQMRASVTQQDFLAFLEYELTCDVSSLLPGVECPVLVVHFDLNAVTTQDMARRFAAAVPDGRLALPRDFRESLRAYSDFLAEAKGTPAEPQAAGDDAALRIFLVANSPAAPGQVERVILANGGTPVSSLAGATASLFDSAQDALVCAGTLAREFGAACGIHAGEPGREPLGEADPALVAAVRAAATAGPGTVAVSNIVRELAAGKGFSFALLEGEPGAAPRLFELLHRPGGSDD